MIGISSLVLNGPLENKCKLTGKELQNKEFSNSGGLEMHDFGARFQDPQIGRWHSLDPFADKYLSLSPYNFVANNPIKNFDPDGKVIKDGKGGVVFAPVATANVTFNDGLSRKVEVGYIFANDGTKVVAYRNLNGDLAAESDCHVASFAQSKLWINNNQVPSLLKGDGYLEVDELKSKLGDIVVYTDNKNNVEDSKTVAVKDPKKGTLVYGQGGLEEKNTLKPIKKAWTPGSPKRFFRKAQKDIVLNDQQVRKLVSDTQNSATSEQLNIDNNRSSQLPEKEKKKN